MHDPHVSPTRRLTIDTWDAASPTAQGDAAWLLARLIEEALPLLHQPHDQGCEPEVLAQTWLRFMAESASLLAISLGCLVPRPADLCWRVRLFASVVGAALPMSADTLDLAAIRAKRRLPPRAIVDGAVATLREAFRDDGAEGESVHLVCDALEAERAAHAEEMSARGRTVVVADEQSARLAAETARLRGIIAEARMALHLFPADRVVAPTVAILEKAGVP